METTHQNSQTSRSLWWSTLDGTLDLAIGGLYWLTWIHPMIITDHMVGRLVIVVVFEVFVVQVTFLLITIPFTDHAPTRRARSAIGICFSYIAMAAAMCYFFHTLWPLPAILLLLANRFWWLLTMSDSKSSESLALFYRWRLQMAVMVAAMCAGLLLNWHYMGINAEVVRAQHLQGIAASLQELHRVIIAGGIYFTSVGVLEVFWPLLGALIRKAPVDSPA